MESDRRFIAFAYITLSLAICFGIYFAINRMTDPFLYWDISFAKLVKLQGELVFPKQAPFASLSLAPGRQILMFQLINMMGVKPNDFQFLPIGTIFLSLTMYLLAYEMLRSSVVSCLVTLYLVANLSHASVLYSTFAYALGFPIMLGFFILCRNFLGKRNLLGLLLLLILFVSLNLIHYTLTVWTILFAIGASTALEIQKLLNQKRMGEMKPVFFISLAFIVFFLTFNETLYQSYIPLISPEILESAIQRFYSFFIFSSTEIFRSPYVFTRPSMINTVSTLTLVIILLPVIIGFIIDLRKMFIEKSPQLLVDRILPINWALILLGIVDSLIYTVRGSISTKSFSMLFPLVALLYLKKLEKKMLYHLVAVLLFVTSLVKMPLFYRDAYYIRGNGTPLERIETSLNWLNSHLGQEKYSILADLNLYGKYLTVSVEKGYIPILEVFNDNKYARVVSISGDAQDFPFPDIVAIDKNSTQPTIGFFWNIYAPLNKYIYEIMNNNSLDVIYEDGDVILARLINLEQNK